MIKAEKRSKIAEHHEHAIILKNDSPISLKEFNTKNKTEQLNLNCNCHGFTFANGKFGIDNIFVQDILDEEYDEVKDGVSDFDTVCFKDTSKNEWVHSCKYEYDLFIQKEGIRKFTVCTDLEGIMEISEYKETQTFFYKKKHNSCPGICMNVIS